MDKPILFSGPMVRAILEGRKTMTRRVIKLPHNNPLGQWESSILGGKGCYDSKGKPVEEFPILWHTRTGDNISCLYRPGDRLWVRETWALVHFSTDEYGHIDAVEEYEGPIPKEKSDKYWSVAYNANFDDIHHDQDDRLIKKWHPSIFMPRWASRITLEVTGVRVERLQEIDELDALNEGTPESFFDHVRGTMVTSAGTQTGDFITGNAVKAFSKLWDSINGKKYPWSSNPWVWAIEFKRIEEGG